MIDRSIVSFLTSLQKKVSVSLALKEPDVLSVLGETPEDTIDVLANKRVYHQVYDMIGIKPRLSKDLYQYDKDVWQTIMDKVSINDIDLICRNNSLIAILGTNPDDDYGYTYENDLSTFISTLNDLSDNYSIQSSMSNDGSYKIYIRSSDPIDETTRVAIVITMDLREGFYAAHSGLINSESQILLYSTPLIATPFIEEFMRDISTIVSTELDVQTRIVEQNLAPSYSTNSVMSLGEVLWTLKKMHADVNTDDEGICISIAGMSHENSSEIIKYLNAFQMPFKSLKKLHHLRKSLKNSHMTIGEMLRIMNDELLNNDLNVSAWTISDICHICKGTGEQEIIQSER